MLFSRQLVEMRSSVEEGDGPIGEVVGEEVLQPNASSVEGGHAWQTPGQ